MTIESNTGKADVYDTFMWILVRMEIVDMVMSVNLPIGMILLHRNGSILMNCAGTTRKRFI